MRVRPVALHAVVRPRLTPGHAPRPRFLLTLAIESSCDDSAACLLETGRCPETGKTAAKLLFHKKVTANNTAFNGVHPLISLESHQENLAMLVEEAIQHLPDRKTTHGAPLHDGAGPTMHAPEELAGSFPGKKLPDFIAVTRGPGMRSNLSTGLDTAKGLAVAWQKPLVGVHHMQAHALTPRLVAALRTFEDASRNKHTLLEDGTNITVQPDFPFLSVLASGGHTLLIRSASLTTHEVMAGTNDIAIGECLDKIARVVLPSDVLQNARNTMYGALLEDFAFPQAKMPAAGSSSPNNDPGFIPQKLNICSEPEPQSAFPLENSTAAQYRSKYGVKYAYEVPRNHEEALKRNVSKWGWGFNQPLAKAAGGLKSKGMEMSFSGLMTAVERVVRYQLDPSTSKLTKTERLAEDISTEERMDIARYAMRAAFEHLAGRVLLGLQQTSASTVVMAGGVAANSYLRYILASTLCAHGYDNVNIVFPPPSLCCDNAAMVAWAGIEMFRVGHRDRLSIRAVRKWPIDQLLSPPIERITQSLTPK